MGKESEKEWIHVYAKLKHFAVYLKLTYYCKSTILQYKIKIKIKKHKSKDRGPILTFTRVQLFATLWTVAYQAPLSMGFSRQEYWSGLPFPPAGIFLTQALCPRLLYLLHGRRILYLLSHLRSPLLIICITNHLKI